MNIYGLIKNNQRLVCIIATGIFVFSFAMFARGAGIQDPNHNPSKYTSLMREVNEFKTGKGDATKKAETVKNLDEFISGEKARLDYIGVSSAKQKKYFKTMESQLKAINEGATGEKSLFSEWFGVGDEQDTVENVDKKIPEAKLPKNPAKFQFSPDPEKVTKLENAKIIPQPKQKLSNELLKLVTIEEAQAVEENVLPVLEDVKSDDKEIKITPEIRELAMKLKNNPVEIVNFVRNSVTYEPYYGAKKGSEGCLAELICNDIDASSLTIALLRAAGIPARYRKSAAIFTVAQLQNLLGVDQTKTAYIALANNGVPVHVLTDLLNNIPFKDADFSQERFLALEWTHVQAFYEYDERGANMENAMNFNSAANTQDVRNALQNLPKKQWIPIDAIVKPYARTTRTILADTAGFNAENFWNSFFQYQGNLSPLGKYKQDIANATGQQIDQNLSEKTSPKKNFDILPITLPYAVASAANQNIQIPVEKFSVLPETYKVKVKISLKRDANDEVVMSRTFAASEVNNARINLSYEGATDVDKAVIEQHGGVHATPSSLVDIIPFFQTNAARYDGVDGSKPVVSIGETLVLKFEYLVKDAQVYTDEKFSVAGNNEGIFTAFSQTQADILLDDLNNENRNSHILLEGNTALAREYAKRVKEDMDVLKKSLDYGANLQFIRAVVTQSRILSEVGGVPTTFDFKGLSLDASAYIADYSNRGAYDNHRKTFRLMWGQQASYLEAQLFKDVAGLSSIATVQGLQFAYAHPETYTVHRITQANAGEIDQLQLSDNTKANMRTDVAAGNTIITPDKPVQDQNWRGILYVSLQPDWMGRYAIGEQATQNGGWTVVEFQINTYQDEENKVHEVNTSLVACAGDCDFLSNPVGKIFDVVIERAADWRAKVIFQEGRQTGSVMCAIDE
ncbi:MAG: transglutaminase family protein, partial [Candidatus Gracilibacteria bacterium]